MFEGIKGIFRPKAKTVRESNPEVHGQIADIIGNKAKAVVLKGMMAAGGWSIAGKASLGRSKHARWKKGLLPHQNYHG